MHVIKLLNPTIRIYNMSYYIYKLENKYFGIDQINTLDLKQF